MIYSVTVINCLKKFDLSDWKVGEVVKGEVWFGEYPNRTSIFGSGT